jgi:signal transduction histidine kinase
VVTDKTKNISPAKGTCMMLNTSFQLDTVMEMAALVSSTLDARQVRERAINAAVRLVDAEAGSLILVDEKTQELFFEVTAGNKGEKLKQERLKSGEGIAGWVVGHGVPLTLIDASGDARFCAQMDFITGFITRDMICVPVVFNGRTLGVLEAINKRGGTFSPQDEQLLVTLANQVAVSLENARLYEENQHQFSQIVAEEKKQRLAKERLLKDLHDGIGGITTNINIMAQLALKSGSTDSMLQALTAITELSREGGAEIRSFMNGFENQDASWHELISEFRRAASSNLEPHGITFSIRPAIHDDTEKVGMYLYMTLLRVFRESLTNIVKHADASVVEVQLNVTTNEVTFSVCDNGKGLGDEHSKGRGVGNMRTRAGDIGGTFAIGSESGTCINLQIPLPLQFPTDGENYAD